MSYFHKLNTRILKSKRRSDGMSVFFYTLPESKDLLIVSLVDEKGNIRTSKSFIIVQQLKREIERQSNRCYRSWSRILMKTKGQEFDETLYG